MARMPDSITPRECAQRLRAAKNVVALTGAGVSTAAGIPDFRGPQGLYVTRRYDPEAIFRLDAFLENPLPFYDFTRDFLPLLDEAEPTLVHRLLAALEASGGLTAVVTQNIDALHARAGSERVVAVHGDYQTSRCLGCGAVYELDRLRGMIAAAPVPRCECGGVVKPDIVFFGEAVHDIDLAQAYVFNSDLLLVLGSSLAVHPAASLPRHARGEVIVVNRGPVELSARPGRWFADCELGAFFAEVADELGMPA